MKTIELKGSFKDVKVFYNGQSNEHSSRSEGNEIKSIIIETDNDFSLMEWKDATHKNCEPKLKIIAGAVLNEDNSEFFAELLKKGVDAVEPEMQKQLLAHKESEHCKVCGVELDLGYNCEGYCPSCHPNLKLHKENAPLPNFDDLTKTAPKRSDNIHTQIKKEIEKDYDTNK